MKHQLIYITFIYLLLVSCSGKVLESEQEILSYINEDESGFVVQKEVNNFTLTVKAIPPQYLAFNESNNQVEYDSLFKVYGKNRTFLLSIKPKEDKDLLFYKVMSKEEFNQRFYDLNFSLGEYLSLKTDKNKYYPALYVMENTYGLAHHRSFNIVFAENDSLHGDLLSSKSYDIAFNDIHFETGITHFKFQKNNIDKFPRVKREQAHE